MKKLLVWLCCCIALLTGLITFTERSKAQSPQPGPVQPTEFYRFVISYADGGSLYTGSNQEGLAWGYTFDRFMAMNRGPYLNMGIYVPPSGWTPDPASGLVPLHRWQVVENGWRVYYYYSTYYGNLGGNYTYHGIQGYVFPPGQTTAPLNGSPLTQLSSWYSTYYGYWYGTGDPIADAGLYVEQPSGTFAFQGVTAAMPTAVTSTRNPPTDITYHPSIWDVTFYPPGTSPEPNPTPTPAPPASSCNATSAMRNACAHNGGWWDDESCSCDY